MKGTLGLETNRTRLYMSIHLKSPHSQQHRTYQRPQLNRPHHPATSLYLDFEETSIRPYDAEEQLLWYPYLQILYKILNQKEMESVKTGHWYLTQWISTTSLTVQMRPLYLT